MKYLSLFSGIEAATVAWHPLGWKCVGVSEVCPFACAVLAHHYPNVPNLGDVTKITEEQIAALGPLDVVVFGSPCQDLSVAGKRKGLVCDETGDTTRSGLFFTAMRIIHWARKHCGLRFALWENVPGAFSSNAGRDFAAVVEHMGGVALDVPPKGWGTEGAAIGTEGMVEWAVLDAQWFGVAQRRRRVFALADFGDWRGRPPILLEPAGLRGDLAPSREAGQAVANCLTDRADRGGTNSEGQRLICMAHGQGGAEIAVDRGPTLTCNHEAPIVAGAICRDSFTGGAGGRPEGASAGHFLPVLSNDPAHAICANEQRTYTNEGSVFQLRNVVATAVAFSCKDHGADASDISPTLRSMGHEDSHANGGGQVAVVFNQVGSTLKGGSGARGYPDPSDGNGHNLVGAVAFSPCGSTADAGDVAPTMRKREGGAAGHGQGVAVGMQVRRLTPRECERLQGFPDDYTLIPVRGKPAADGPRYKALGNSMAVPVMRWIGQGIDAVGLFQ